MKRVSIPVFKNCTPLAVIGAMELLNGANKLQQMLQEAAMPAFKVELISLWEREVVGSHNYPVYCHKTVADVVHTDLIIIPSLDHDVEKNLSLNRGYVPWIQEQAAAGAEIASMCTGAFMLAETGLLDGRKATTHWYYETLFREMFPAVQLVPEQIIVEEDGVYSCGGTNSYLNLMLYFIEKFCGRETALFAAKMFLIDYDKISQKQYSIFSVQKQHKDDKILAAQKYMEENFDKGISVDDVINNVHISRRSFIRRFKKATGNTPLEYLQRIKIETVKKQLESSDDPISEIIYQIGYSDATAFRQVFKKHTGMSPMAYRKKYRHRLIMV